MTGKNQIGSSHDKAKTEVKNEAGGKNTMNTMNAGNNNNAEKLGQQQQQQLPTGQRPPVNAQQYVDHTYTDYAIVEEDDLRLLDQNSSLLPNPTSSKEASAREKLKGMSCTYGPMKKNAGGVVQPFPGKLLEVLDRSDLDDIIDWMPHGRSFIVKKPKLFTTNVLPRFFKQTKFLSFTRQLNLWGFKRITRGVDAGAYYHELFLRGRPYLAMRMRRQKIKGTGITIRVVLPVSVLRRVTLPRFPFRAVSLPSASPPRQRLPRTKVERTREGTMISSSLRVSVPSRMPRD
mmetsp:Transcript_34804/g.73437  ORF Transcript_34804/g.73437 Transcript_34804/m.73437 type:complete len:289 (-) Transcript_34804:195-1061(-)